jgi:hypothetical protein
MRSLGVVSIRRGGARARFAFGLFLHRLLAAVLITIQATGCASGPASPRPESRARTSQITSMAAVAVEVTVISSSLFRGDEVRRDWSDTARANLMHAIAKHFGQDPRFVFKDWPAEDTETIQQDLEQVRHAIAETPATTPDNEVACLSGPAVALADAAGTDTVLLVYARDSIMTPGSLAALIPLAVVALPLMLFLEPFFRGGSSATAPRVGVETVALCLVDPRRGETIWFHTEPLGFGNLLDASDVEGVIQRAYAKFKGN